MVRPPEILSLYRIKEIATLCAVTVKTARNWKQGKVFPPATAIMVLNRDLGCFNPAWAGWHISLRGELCSPENWACSKGDVLSIQFLQAQLSAWRNEAQKLREQIEGGYEDQPLPENWSIQTG